MRRPKFALLLGPHSPFSAGLVRSQSGMKLLLLSVQARVVVVLVVVPIGLTARARLTPSLSRYLPTLNLIAVLPVPNTS